MRVYVRAGARASFDRFVPLECHRRALQIGPQCQYDHVDLRSQGETPEQERCFSIKVEDPLQGHENGELGERAHPRCDGVEDGTPSHRFHFLGGSQIYPVSPNAIPMANT